MNSPAKRIIERKLNIKLPAMRTPLSILPTVKKLQPSGQAHSGDFMPVLLGGFPPATDAMTDQIEIWLPDGTRIVATGEKCISFFSAMIKESL
ncbi:MAG: hypothetical protein K0B08_11810 [Bacteroidales bacterium]|nr:hypothetical protein [Bacteroidales bacterium]